MSRHPRSTPVQHVREPATKPRLILRLVAPDIDRLVEDVCVVPSKACHFLFNADPRLIHQVVVSRVPVVIAARDSAWNATTGGLYGVFSDDLRFKRRQFAVPIRDSFNVGALDCVS